MASSRTARLLTESLRAKASPAAGKTVKFTRRRLVIAAVVSIVLVAAAGLWSSHAVMESVAELLVANLEANLNVSATALTAWIESELALVRFWAEDEQLRDLVQAHLRSGPGDGSLEELQKLLASGYTAKEVKDWAIFDREGNFIYIDSDNTDQGRTTAAAMKRYHAKVMQGQSVFVPPVRLSKLVEGYDDAEEMFIVMAAPVRDREGAVIAALLFGEHPDGNFSRILQASRMGESGDTFAFDRDGLLISRSRFEKELLALGLAQGSAGPRSISQALIRDPGGDLSAGFKPNTPPDNWPPTRMLASAQKGESGIDLSGYRDIRGETVAGAWRWLPEFDFGIAIEVSHEKIKGITRPIRLAVQGLMGLMVVLAGLILFSTIWVSRLQKNIEEIKQVGH